jgi:ABC-2 type transport system permease protein
MRLYAEVTKLSLRRHSTYRGAMVAGTVTNLVFGFIRANVLQAAIGVGTVAGYSAQSATAFTFATQALIAATSIFGDFSLASQVRSGEVATELVRPWDWSVYRLATDIGRAVYALLTRGLAIMLVGWIAYQLPIPPLDLVLQFVLCIAAAIVLASRLWTIAAMIGFWMVDASGVIQIVVAAAALGSGLLLPIALYPDWLAGPLRWSPFASLIQNPVDVLLAKQRLLPVLALQLLWIAALEVLLRIELRYAMKKLVVQGG